MALTYDGRYARLYVDGSLKAVNDAGGDFPLQYAYPTNSALIGADPGPGSTPENEYFTGHADEVRIYNRALSLTDIRELHGGGPYKRLEGHDPLDGDTQDISGYGRDASNHGAVAVADARGREAMALAFDGTSAYLDLGEDLAFRPTDGLTAYLWAYRSNWQSGSTSRTLMGNTQAVPSPRQFKNS